MLRLVRLNPGKLRLVWLLRAKLPRGRNSSKCVNNGQLNKDRNSSKCVSPGQLNKDRLKTGLRRANRRKPRKILTRSKG